MKSIIRIMSIMCVVLVPAVASAQNEVIFCGIQSDPPASSYQVVVDAGSPVPLTMDASLDGVCAGGDTHSFRLTLDTTVAHTVQVIASTPAGDTFGPVYDTGALPGTLTIRKAVVTIQVQTPPEE